MSATVVRSDPRLRTQESARVVEARVRRGRDEASTMALVPRPALRVEVRQSLPLVAVPARPLAPQARSVAEMQAATVAALSEFRSAPLPEWTQLWLSDEARTGTVAWVRSQVPRGIDPWTTPGAPALGAAELGLTANVVRGIRLSPVFGEMSVATLKATVGLSQYVMLRRAAPFTWVPMDESELLDLHDPAAVYSLGPVQVFS